MAEIITIIIFYFFGITIGIFFCHPDKQFEEGWNSAKKFFTDWDDGFCKGVEHASKVFKDYDQGFGDGFESGWYAALEQMDKDGEHKNESG